MTRIQYAEPGTGEWRNARLCATEAQAKAFIRSWVKTAQSPEANMQGPNELVQWAADPTHYRTVTA